MPAPRSPGLLRLRLRNFKSYPDNVDIDLAEGPGANPFVSVVGPNGSGKSNLLDAISFVIGLSADEMRCQSLHNLVHSDAQDRLASVEAVLVNQSFKRTTDDKFYIGSTTGFSEVSKDHYIKEWSRINVHGAFCIVQQGAIEGIASQSAVDLSKLIETLSPEAQEIIPEHKRLAQEVRYHLSSSRKSHSNRRLAQDDVRKLSELASARERYEQIKSQLHTAEEHRKQLAAQIYNGNLGLLTKERDSIQSELDAAKTEYDSSVKSKKDLQQEFAKEKRRIQNARQSEQRVNSDIDSLAAEKQPLEKRIQVIEQELRLLEPEQKTAQADLDALLAEKAKIERKLDDLTSSSSQQTHVKKTNKSAKSSVASHRADIAETLSSWTAETVDEREKLQKLERESFAIDQRVASAEKIVGDTTSSMSILERALSDHNTRELQLDTSLEENKAMLQQTLDELSDVSSEQSSVKETIKELKPQLTEAANQLKRSDGNRRSEKRRARILDVVSKLRREFPGVIDVLASTVDVKFERDRIALDRVLSPNAESVVVDTRNTAIACIERLRSEQLTLSFLPLDSLQPSSINPHLRKLQGASLLLDAVECSVRMRPAVAYALGDTLVADSMQAAIELRRNQSIKSAIVIRNGAMLTRTGLMSGGGSDSSLRERAAAGLQRRVRSLSDKLKAALDRQIVLQDEEDSKSSTISRLQQLVQVQETQLSDEKRREESLNKNLDHLKRTLVESEKALKEVTFVKKALETERDSLNRTLKISKTTQFKSLAKKLRLNVDDLLEEAARLESETSSIAVDGIAAEFARQRARLSELIEFSSEQIEVAQNRRAEVQARMEALLSAKAQATEQLAAKEAAESQLVSRKDKAASRSSNLREIIEDRSDAMSAAEAAVESALAVVSGIEQRLNIAEDRLEAFANSSSDPSNDSDKAPAPVSTAKLSRLEVERDTLDDEIEKLRNELAEIAVSRHVDEDKVQAEKSLEEASAAASSQRTVTAELQLELDKLSSQRRDYFQTILESLQEALSGVYSELTGGGQALLTPLNAEEPFEDGVTFSAMPPGKFYCPINQMSGGERSLAALSLLLAVQLVKPSPFVVLDEVDAALDGKNVGKIANYLHSHCSQTQFVVVSLKPRLYQRATHLLGIYKESHSSRALTLTLERT